MNHNSVHTIQMKNRTLPASQISFLLFPKCNLELDVFFHEDNIMNGGECPDRPADAERASGHMAEGLAGHLHSPGARLAFGSWISCTVLMGIQMRITIQSYWEVTLWYVPRSLRKFITYALVILILKSFPKQYQRCGRRHISWHHLGAAAPRVLCHFSIVQSGTKHLANCPGPQFPPLLNGCTKIDLVAVYKKPETVPITQVAIQPMLRIISYYYKNVHHCVIYNRQIFERS